jgi:MoaA/NifB/PqqE/SkfB family radical SAM enzyme
MAVLQVLDNTISKDLSRVHYQSFHNIFLYVTERCQLRCGHCYMGDRLERGLTLDFAVACRILANCRKLGADYITFLGGEPTLHPELPQMIDHAHELGFRQVMIDSNGLSLARIQRIAPEKLYYVTISLDGATAETHDRVRGAGTFQKTQRTIEGLVADGYNVRINSTIFRFNLHEAPKVIEYAERVGVKLVNFHSFSEEGYGSDKPDWALSRLQWIDFCDWIDTIRQECSISVWYPPTWARVEKMNQYVKEGFQGCLGCSLDRLSIFPDGRCYVCSVLFDHAIHFAIMTDEGLVLNRGTNEFYLFPRAAYRASERWATGCPAEARLTQTSESDLNPSLVSMCRCWKSQG